MRGSYGLTFFGIYCANEDIIHCFFHDESIGGSGPKEVISLLNYLLKSLQEKYGKFHHLILWADNSPLSMSRLAKAQRPAPLGSLGTSWIHKMKEWTAIVNHMFQEDGKTCW